jgi:hypothetical protein
MYESLWCHLGAFAIYVPEQLAWGYLLCIFCAGWIIFYLGATFSVLMCDNLRCNIFSKDSSNVAVVFAFELLQVILPGFCTDFGRGGFLDFIQEISRTVLAYIILNSVTTVR